MNQRTSIRCVAIGVFDIDRLPWVQHCQHTIILCKIKTWCDLLFQHRNRIFTFNEMGVINSHDFSVDSLLRLPEVIAFIKEHGNHVLSYGISVETENCLIAEGLKPLSNAALTHYFGSKINFRKEFENKILFPDYIAFSHVTEVKKTNIAIESLGEKTVWQISDSSGGRGTLYVKNSSNSFDDAITLMSKDCRISPLIISEHIDGVPVSFQLCMNQINCSVIGPCIQIENISSLRASDIFGQWSFCGALLGGALPRDLGYYKWEKQIREIVQFLWNLNFRGICGIDAIIKKDRIYFIEINLRITGVTLPLVISTSSKSVARDHVEAFQDSDVNRSDFPTIKHSFGPEKPVIYLLAYAEDSFISNVTESDYHEHRIKLSDSAKELGLKLEHLMLPFEGAEIRKGMRSIRAIFSDMKLATSDAIIAQASMLICEINKNIQHKITTT